MAKMKTNKSAAKRFRVTKSGRLKRSHAGMAHILGKKSQKRKRNLRKSGLVAKSDENQMKRLLPYI